MSFSKHGARVSQHSASATKHPRESAKRRKNVILFMVSGVLVLVTLSFPDLRLQNIMTWRVWGSKAVVAWKPANLENEESRVPLALQGTWALIFSLRLGFLGKVFATLSNHALYWQPSSALTCELQGEEKILVGGKC